MGGGREREQHKGRTRQDAFELDFFLVELRPKIQLFKNMFLFRAS